MSQREAIVKARRKRLLGWIQTHYGGKQAAFVKAVGENQGLVSSLLADKSFGEALAARLETKARMPAGYLVSPLTEPGPLPGRDPLEVDQRASMAEEEIDALKGVMTTFMQIASEMMPSVALAVAARLRTMPKDVSLARQQVIDAAISAAESGLRSKAQEAQPDAPSGSLGTRPRKGR